MRAPSVAVRRRGRVAPSVLISLASWVLAAAASADAPPALIVALRAEGAHALEDCAEGLFRRGLPLAGATADGSGSLDEALRDAHVHRVRALFRRPDGSSFREQRARLRARLARRLRESPAGARRRDIREEIPELAHVYRFELAPGSSLEEAKRRLAGDVHVAWVQADHVNALDQVPPLPDDPFLYSSGSWGQQFEDLWGLYRIRAPEAWSVARGEGVVVAVVDTGLDYEHPDIADNVWVNPGEDLDGNGRVDASDWNGIDDDDNGFVDDLRGWDFANSVDANQDGDYLDPEDLGDPDPFDDYGHGTHVAGTIAAVADNGIGIAGVAPAARIMPLKGFDANGSGRDSDLWRAVLYAAENGARVINNSWSCSPLCPENPLAEEIVSLVHAMGVVIVTSAGNRQTDVVFNSPEKLRETITVASSGQDDRPSASFTNFGWLVDVAAPGGGPSDDRNVYLPRRNILSLRSSGDDSAAYATVAPGYWRLSGTSMAAPHVAGAAALLLSADPTLSYESVRRLLRQGAFDTGPPGPDRDMGAGRLDVAESLARMPLPDLRAAITGPGQGSVFAPQELPVLDIRGTAAGSALAGFELRYGHGNVPDEWLPIAASSTPVEDGVLASWPIADLEEGTYVVRLDVRGDGGEQYSEFLVLSLERNAFHAISEPARPARAPSISRGVVVWESPHEPDASDEPEEARNDFDLLGSRFAGDHPFVLSDAPGNQRSASISEGVVGWTDTRNGLDQPEIFGCELRGGKRCDDLPLSEGWTVAQAPASAGGHVFWLDGRTGQNDLHGCRPDAARGRCLPVDTGVAPGQKIFLTGNGDGLAWTEPGQRVGACVVDARTGRCHDRSPSSSIWAYSRPAASGDLLAFVETDFRGRLPLRLCELHPGTGACDPITVAEGVEDPEPVLSGNRLVWDASLGSEASDVFYCEYDRVRRRCPVQRVTAHHAPQRASAIDGRELVFEDERSGPPRVYGIRLPGLAPIRDRRVQAGRTLVIPVIPERDPGREAPLDLDVEAVDLASLEAAPPETVGARFLDLHGIGVFLWRPDASQVGTHAFTFSGTTASGLVTRQTIRVDVVPRPRGGWLRGLWRRLSRAVAAAQEAGDPAGEGSRTGRPAR